MQLKNYTGRKTALELLWLGSVMTTVLSGCCLKPRPATDHDPVIVVEKSEIVQNPDGSYTVSEGWMLQRMNMEQNLGEALSMCIGGEE